MKKTLTLNYYLGGKPSGDLREKTFLNNEDTYCPNCGDSLNVWVEEGDGDYYEGPSYYCTTCNHKFAIPRLIEIKEGALVPNDKLELEILAKLREAQDGSDGILGETEA